MIYKSCVAQPTTKPSISPHLMFMSQKKKKKTAVAINDSLKRNK